MTPTTANQPDFTTPKLLRKLAKQVARKLKGLSLTYDQWRAFNKEVRKRLDIERQPKRKLPKVMTEEQLQRLIDAVDRTGNVQHALMIRLLFFTGCRVAEMVNMQIEDIDLATGRIRVMGKGKKERTVLVPRSFLLTLKVYLGNRRNGPVFVSRQGGNYTTRRVRQIVDGYAKPLGIRATPHTFRHQLITYLTNKGLLDREIQLLSGHSHRDALIIYQHLALNTDLEEKYNKALSGLDLNPVQAKYQEAMNSVA